MSTPPNTATMTPLDRRAAREHAESLIAECYSADDGPIDALDAMSDITACAAHCPKTFTLAQKAYVQKRVLAAYLKAIGRA